MMLAMIAGIAMTIGVSAGGVSVTAVTAQQRYPWNGLVDIAVSFDGASNDVAKTACEFFATNGATLARLPFASVHSEGAEAGSGSVWTRRYVWDARADVGEVKIDDVILAVRPTAGGVQLWEDGPCWAECNVGAKRPEESGCFFCWGGTTAYEYANGSWRAVDGSADGFSFSSGECPTFGKSGLELAANGYIDETGNLTADHDAATACLGSPWRLPTAEEYEALTTNCTSEWTVRFGVSGLLMRGKGAFASRSVFFPASGFVEGSVLDQVGGIGRYWSSTPETGMVEGGRILLFTPYLLTRVSVSRYFGQNVRAVRGAETSATDAESVATHLELDCRTGVRIASATERICFSPAWETSVNGATATVKLDGVPVANAADSGMFAWTPVKAGLYRFTHAVTVAGKSTGAVESATFAVGVSDLESLYAPAANGERVIDCFLAGVDPEGSAPDDPQSKFLAGIDADADEVSISWSPDLNGDGSVARIYRVLGCDDLDARQWEAFRPWHRFFKVVATLPSGDGDEETAVSGQSFVPQAKPRLSGVQLWKDGPLWAEWNVGARTPEEFGDLFWWGDTIGYAAEGGVLTTLGGAGGSYYADVTWVSSAGSRSGEGPFRERTCPTCAKPLSVLQELGYVDSTGTLVGGHDAAAAHHDAPWRMPTAADFAALVGNCDWERTTRNGVNGLLVRGRGEYASASVFFPACGYGHESAYCNPNAFGRYWTSTAGAGFDAVQYIFTGGGFSRNDSWQNQGAAVRPVRDAAE